MHQIHLLSYLFTFSRFLFVPRATHWYESYRNADFRLVKCSRTNPKPADIIFVLSCDKQTDVTVFV